VIEADEYDTAFFDKRSKFVHYRPSTAVLNNLEFDHADIFPDLAAIETQFHHLIRTIPGSGQVIAPGADAAIDRVLSRGLWSGLERFDHAGAWQAGPAREVLAHAAAPLGWSEFEVRYREQPVAVCRLPLTGAHNRSNALAAIAAAVHAGVAAADAVDALSRFGGVRRRMEVRGEAAGVTVIDDFAHHPTAMATTLAGLRARLPAGARLLAVFEPRSNTMKLGAMKARLAGSLIDADLSFCFSGGLGWDAKEALAPLGARAQVLSTHEALVRAIVQASRPGDRVLVMSNGGFGGIHERLLQALEQGARALNSPAGS
jgi:UDP-N-acetylmuramate: L-alanyl-gamma-D-glutamyl-meso-diaminopimelate ligase